MTARTRRPGDSARHWHWNRRIGGNAAIQRPDQPGNPGIGYAMANAGAAALSVIAAQNRGVSWTDMGMGSGRSHIHDPGRVRAGLAAFRSGRLAAPAVAHASLNGIAYLAARIVVDAAS